MNRILFMGIFVALTITANAQDDIPKDSLTMEWKSMFRNLPEVMIKGSHPIVKVERGLLLYNMPLLLKQLPADNAYEALTRIPGVSDATGNISFLDNEVTLIVNGQATTLTQEQLTERLKAMPVAQLAKAEVMLSAPARYHVRGMAINIVTKDYAGTNQLSGQVIGGMKQSKYAKGFGDLYLSLQRDKFGLDAQYKYVNGNSYGESSRIAGKWGVRLNGNNIFNNRFDTRSVQGNQDYRMKINYNWASVTFAVIYKFGGYKEKNIKKSGHITHGTLKKGFSIFVTFFECAKK